MLFSELLVTVKNKLIQYYIIQWAANYITVMNTIEHYQNL